MIILHMAALRVNGTVSFVCQHLSGCHTSAEYNLICAINMSLLHSPQGICLLKCLTKLPSLLKAWRQNLESMSPRLGTAEAQLSLSRFLALGIDVKGEREPPPTLVLLAAALAGKICRQILLGSDSVSRLLCDQQKMSVTVLMVSSQSP